MDPLAIVSQRRGNSGRQTQDDIAANLANTEAALKAKLGLAIPSNKKSTETARYVRYQAKPDAPGATAATANRIIRIEEAQVDPLEPTKIKHKKVPAAPTSPPPPVLRSPPKKLTKEDQAIWKIPPCVSNWKNQKGYVIPLDKRIAADGRGLQDVTLNEKHAAFAEDLYIAERKAREEIRIRNELSKQQKAREEEKREQELREIAAKARAEALRKEREAKQGGDDEAADRQKALKEARYDVLRDHRMAKAGKKRDREEARDVSEAVALGKQVQPSLGGSRGDSLYDNRLFNQTGGIGSGFAEDDANNIYDKRLFSNRADQGAVYKFDKKRLEQHEAELDDMGGAEGGPEVPSSSAWGTGKKSAFKGGEESMRGVGGVVAFEKDDSSDPFGLGEMLDQHGAKKRKQ